MAAKTFLLACACFCLSSTAVAQVYKWIDERGVTHYGDTPPAHRSTTQIAVPKEPQVSGRKPATAQARCSSADCPKSDRSNEQSNPPARAEQRIGVTRIDRPTTAQLSPIERAIADCKANRGADCNKPAEIERWVRQSTPLTPEELAAAQREAGARAAAAARIQMEWESFRRR
jgi:hypothetical protein